MPLEAIAIRLAAAADLDLIAPLFDAYRQFYGQPADLPLARAFLADRLRQGDSVIFLAVRAADGTAVGFTQLYPAFSSVAARRIWILNDLFVAPDARRSGVARGLMDAARQHGVRTGARRLVLSTAHTNGAAQRLYESLGYVRDEQFVQYKLEL
jgi:ribosomal protein S18 acetylase RimI-like enzyme